MKIKHFFIIHTVKINVLIFCSGLDVGANDRWEYLLVGEPMNEVAIAEGEACKGDLVISPKVYHLLQTFFTDEQMLSGEVAVLYEIKNIAHVISFEKIQAVSTKKNLLRILMVVQKKIKIPVDCIRKGRNPFRIFVKRHPLVIIKYMMIS
jgi:hypothetical protein